MATKKKAPEKTETPIIDSLAEELTKRFGEGVSSDTTKSVTGGVLAGLAAILAQKVGEKLGRG
jgi:hypothetical protein